MEYVLKEIFTSYELDDDYLEGAIELSPVREFYVQVYGLEDDPLELDYIIRCLIKGEFPDIFRFPFKFASMTDSEPFGDRIRQVQYELTPDSINMKVNII